MTHLKAVNRKAARVVDHVTRQKEDEEKDVVALQRTGLPQQPHFPLGCSLVFSPGWEADQNGGTAGPASRSSRHLRLPHRRRFWPAQVPDQLNPHRLTAAPRPRKTGASSISFPQRM